MREQEKKFSTFQKLFITGIIVLPIIFAVFYFSALGETIFNITLRSQDTLEQNLLVHWTMDGKDFDGSLTTGQIRDTSGQGHHGTFFGSGGS